MNELSAVSSHLTDVLELVASENIGEAKYRLQKLIGEVEASPIPDTEGALAKLQESQDLFRVGDFVHGGICLASASQLLRDKLK